MRSALVAVVCVCGCGRVGFEASAGDSSSNGDARSGGAGDAAGTTGGDAPQAASCTGLAAICGPSGTASCCSSPLVPGGTFYRSYDVGTDGMYTSMASPATVSDFRLDTYEVTVARFRHDRLESRVARWPVR